MKYFFFQSYSSDFYNQAMFFKISSRVKIPTKISFDKNIFIYIGNNMYLQKKFKK